MKKNQDYRFAFVGVTSSGKTCILGRLAQQADADARYSSTLVNPALKTDASNAPSDSEEDIAVKGYNKIREAQTAFENNQCPEATPTHETGRLLVTFDMTDEERGEFRIRTEDYSGELINEELLSSQESATNELTRKLSQYDGLIFVVETLAPGEDIEKARTYANNVCRIFSAIEDCMSPHKWETTPLAIIFSKWDKFSNDIDFSNPEAEESKLVDYSKQYPIYENLVKRIRHKTKTQDSLSDLESESSEETTEQRSESEQGKITENTKCFPVSAFGKSVLENGKYRPDKNAQAFGIVAPFAWMVNRLDELTRIELEKESRSVWNWFNAFGLHKRARTALQRIPKKTEHGKALSRIKHNAAIQCWINVAIWLLLAYSFCFGSLCGVDSYKLSQYKKVVNTQSSTPEQVAQAEKAAWAYVNNSFRNSIQFIRSTKSVSNGIIEATNERDEVLWKGVESAKSDAEKYEATMRYLKIFPNGKYKEKAINNIAEFEDTQKNKEIEELNNLLNDESTLSLCIDQCNAFIEHYKQGVHVDEAKKISAKALDKIQLKEIEEIKALEDNKLAIERCNSFIEIYKTGARVDEVRKVLHERISAMDRAKRIAAYRSLYRNKDEKSLAETLIGIIHDYDSTATDVKKLIDEFPDAFKDVLNRKCEGKSENAIIETYELALHTVDSLLEALNGNEIIQNLKPYLNEQIKKHVIAMDKSLYQAIQKNPSLSNIDNYLNKMGKYDGGNMLKEVTAYKNWLLGQDEEKEYTVSIKMRWSDKTPKYKTRIKIWVDDLSSEKYNQNGIAISPNLEKGLTDVKIKKKFRSDSVYFKVEVVSEGNWWGNEKNYGAGGKTFLVSSLVSSGEFDLTPYGTVVVKIIDAPTKPQLPQWKEK